MSTQLNWEQITQAWIDAQSTELKEIRLDHTARACDLVDDYLKVPYGNNLKASAAACGAMVMPAVSSWIELLALVADDQLDQHEPNGYLPRVRAAQAADKAKRAAKRSKRGGAS